MMHLIAALLLAHAHAFTCAPQPDGATDPFEALEFYAEVPGGDGVVEGVARVARPDGPARGVIFALHGSGGNYQYWAELPEHRVFVNEAVARGWMVIAPQAASGSTWSFYDWSADYQNLRWLFEQVALPELTGDFRVAVIGHSQGGSMAGMVPHLFPVDHVVIANSRAAVGLSGDQLPPFGWPDVTYQYGVNDPTVDADEVQDQIAATAGLGLTPLVLESRSRTVSPDVLTRVEGVGCDAAYALHRQLVRAGHLTRSGRILVAPTERQMASLLPATHAHLALDLSALIDAWHAGHAFSAEYTTVLLDRFEG